VATGDTARGHLGVVSLLSFVRIVRRFLGFKIFFPNFLNFSLLNSSVCVEWDGREETETNLCVLSSCWISFENFALFSIFISFFNFCSEPLGCRSRYLSGGFFAYVSSTSQIVVFFYKWWLSVILWLLLFYMYKYDFYKNEFLSFFVTFCEAA